ncbi:Aldose 1-/Glucose-6-phosphate 1-epimerase [Arabidopsis thaliana x Arabidopsis arenosa]|uniref:Aldose 1-/Glucose-6-phosphate 1-epimerase n=1 Tax=Arabidopsis thaliana x Arabidopsis arenosa TaxID=1240361 RepID=A0A8T2AU88_9BRAS|nr:Aldose 1-/Glucose-6-phosphate 1-epimerase [Arabidopsis thaliana x Arabidopsis arenosa]
MVSVSLADNNEEKSTDLKKVKRGVTDRSISKVNDDGHDDDNEDHDDHDDNNDHDNDHDHDHDNDGDDDHDDDDNKDDGDDDDDKKKTLGVHELKKGNLTVKFTNRGASIMSLLFPNKNGKIEDIVLGYDRKKTLGVHELKKGNLTVKFTNRGASIMSLLFPNQNGKIEDIVLGYDSVNDYMNDTVFCGVTLARVANKREKTVANDGKHGGTKESGDVIWTVKKHNHNGKKPYIVFTYTSPDGDHQGKLEVTVTYKLVGENKLEMVMEAKAKEKATPVNLVHRSYWNLGGHNNEDILSEEIQILGSGYAHLDDNLTPTGKILAVKGTPYDFRQLRPIKDNINELKTGYGINYCLDGVANKMRKVVELVDKKSKIKMELSTDQSGLKFYTGGRLKKNKNGSVYKAYSGLCLESHAINYQYRPSQIVEPGKTYKHTMLFKFSIVP